MTFDNFRLNEATGSKAENAVLQYLNRNGTAVRHPRGEYDTDIDWTTPDGEVHTVGVECINEWGDHEVYPWKFYNSSTHKRARKIMSGEESILFVVNKPCTRFMVISGQHHSEGMVPVESNAWLKGVNGKFQRGGTDDPLRLATCPWGTPRSGEWCFKVPRRKTTPLDSTRPVDYKQLSDLKVWSGPKKLQNMVTLNGAE